MKLIIASLITIILVGCDDRVTPNNPVIIRGISSYTGITCLYTTISVVDAHGLYSENVPLGDMEDTCNKFHIGDTIQLVAIKSNLISKSNRP